MVIFVTVSLGIIKPPKRDYKRCPIQVLSRMLITTMDLYDLPTWGWEGAVVGDRGGSGSAC